MAVTDNSSRGAAPAALAAAACRAARRLAMARSFYVMDPETGLPTKPRAPHRAFNQDSEQARSSLRRLAELPLREAWPGHGRPLTGDVRRALLVAAGAP